MYTFRRLFNISCRKKADWQYNISCRKMQIGRTLDEVKMEIPAVPETKPIPSLSEEALKIISEIYKSKGTVISEEKFNEKVKGLQKWTLLTYNKLVPSNCQSCIIL